MSDPRTDFFASGGGAATPASTQDARTAFFASPEPSKSSPIVYDAAEFKRRIGRSPNPAELENFQRFKGAGWAGDPAQGRFTGGQAAVGAVEDALSLGTGMLAGVPAGVTYLGSGGNLEAAKKVQSALTYVPRTEAGRAGLQGIGEVMSGPGKVAQFAADKIDSSGKLSDTLGDVGERTMMASGILPGVAAVRGGLLSSIGRTAKRVADAVTNSVRDPEAVTTAENVMADASRNSPQSMGAAAASPRISNASPQLQHAVVTAAQKTGGAINPEAMARHLEADTLPVPVQLTEGEALNDVTKISHERNNPGLAEFYNKRNGALKQNIQAIRDQVGPEVFSRNEVEHGDTLIKAYQDKAAAADADITTKYQALRDANNGNFPADSKQLFANANTALKKEMLASKAPKDVMASLQEAADRGSITLDEFETARTRLAQIARGSADGQERYAAGVIRQEMEKLPVTGNAAKLKGLADEARNAARQQFQALEADPAYKAAVEGSVKPDQFARKFVIGGTRDDVAKMAENLKDNETARQTMSVAAIDHLRDAAGVNPDGTGAFGQARYNKALRALDPKLRSLVLPGHAETLEQLGNVARYTQEQPPGNFINNSKTFVAAAAEGAKGLAEHAVNSKTLGIGGTAVRSFAQKRAAKAELRRITAPGAGLDVLETK